MKMTPIIRVENLTKRYKKAKTNALVAISFQVAAGEFFALLGPNGAGKTTTISILTTTLLPSSGTVMVADHDVTQHPSLVRQEIGIIFQKPSLDRNLTAEENVRFHALLYGLYPYRPSYKLMPKAYKAKVDELSSILGIDKEIFNPIKTFSSGMMRKLEILRCLIHDPRVLFLDEPTAGLDANSRRALWSYLNEVREHNETTIFLTTHYLEEAEQANAICIIDQGKVLSFGSPDEIKADLIDEYILLDTADRPKLLEELKRLDVDYSAAGPFRIKSKPHQIHQLLKAIKTPLTMIKTHSPTLEDAYLEIIKRSSWN